MSLIRARYRAVNTVMNLGGARFVGLLDLYPNAAVAYALFKLRADYSGSAIRVRESGGNTEADIGFTASGELDTAVLLAHCGANDGFIVTWYDQSGNSIDFENIVAAQQPQIVSSGSILLLNGMPIINRVNTSSTLKSSFTPNDGSATKTAIFVGSVSPTRGNILGSHASPDDYWMFGQNGSTSTAVNQNVTPSSEFRNGVAFSYTNRDNVYDDFVSQSMLFSNLQFSFSSNTLSLGYQSNVTTNTNMMNYQVLIIYNSDQIANRVGMQSKLNEFLNVF